jgi:hypothetical protein
MNKIGTGKSQTPHVQGRSVHEEGGRRKNSDADIIIIKPSLLANFMF